MKASPEIKKLADKYCDENGGPLKEKESPLAEADYAGVEARILYWMDEYDEIAPTISLDEYARDFFKETYLHWPEERKKPKKEKSTKLEKSWTKFNPTPKNPKRGRR